MEIKRAASPLAFAGGIFFFVGMIFFVIGIVLLISYISFTSNAVKTDAVITKITSHSGSKSGSTSHTVWIEYNVDGEAYTGTAGYYSKGMKRGDIVKVYYDPLEPQIMKSGTPLLEVIFTFLGGTFAAIGGGMIGSAIAKAARRKRLLREGERLIGTVVRVFEQTDLRINGVHPLKAEVEVIDSYSGIKNLYISEGVMSDIWGLVGMTASVYVDCNDRSKYYVDLEGIYGDRFN